MDFNPSVDLVPFSHLLVVDQCFLATLGDLRMTVVSALEKFSVSAAVGALLHFCRVTCAFYFEMAKMRLYFDSPNSEHRRSAQTTCHYFLETLVLLLAPFLSFLSEEVHQTYTKNFGNNSVHLRSFSEVPQFEWEVGCARGMESARCTWEKVMAVRGEVNRKVEEERGKGSMKTGFECGLRVVVNVGAKEGVELDAFLGNFLAGNMLADFFLVSEVEYKRGMWEGGEVVNVEVVVLEKEQCFRCRRFNVEKEGENLCGDCEVVVRSKSE